MDLYLCTGLFKTLIKTSGVASIAALSKALPSEKCLKPLTVADIQVAAGGFEQICEPPDHLCSATCVVKALQTWVQAVPTPSDPSSLSKLTAWGGLHSPEELQPLC